MCGHDIASGAKLSPILLGAHGDKDRELMCRAFPRFKSTKGPESEIIRHMLGVLI